MEVIFTLNDKTIWDRYWACKQVSENLKLSKDPLYMDIISYLPSKKEYILEAGCGAGRWLFHLQRLGYNNLVGLDFSKQALNQAKHCKKALLVWGDIRNLPFKDETFAMIISLGVIEHVPDPNLPIKEMARVLRRGGFLFLSTPNLFPHALVRWIKKKIGRWGLGYEDSYTPEDLADLIKGASSLNVVKMGNRGLGDALGFLGKLPFFKYFPFQRLDHTFVNRFGLYSFCIAMKES